MLHKGRYSNTLLHRSLISYGYHGDLEIQIFPVFQDVRYLPQFFITLNVCQHLDGKHAIFGRVCSGMGTVKRIGNVQTGAMLIHIPAAPG